MHRYFIFLAVVIITACNSRQSSAETKAKSTDSSMVTAVWPKEDENEFLAGCIESLKGKLPEDSAFMHCNCVLMQLKQKFPNMDSASNYLMDTAKAAEIAAHCK